MLIAFVSIAMLAFSLALASLAFADGVPTKAESPAAGASNEDSSDGPTEKQLFTGTVVLLRDALQKRSIKAYDEMKDQVVLETPDGELIPIIADWRGRAFFQDERLRNRKVELIGSRREGVPYLQVVMIFTFSEDGERQYTDYWCDICSIPMYEIKPCDCCQEPIRLRFQPRSLPDYLIDSTDDAAAAPTQPPPRTNPQP